MATSARTVARMPAQTARSKRPTKTRPPRRHPMRPATRAAMPSWSMHPRTVATRRPLMRRPKLPSWTLRLTRHRMDPATRAATRPCSMRPRTAVTRRATEAPQRLGRASGGGTHVSLHGWAPWNGWAAWKRGSPAARPGCVLRLRTRLRLASARRHRASRGGPAARPRCVSAAPNENSPWASARRHRASHSACEVTPPAVKAGCSGRCPELLSTAVIRRLRA